MRRFLIFFAISLALITTAWLSQAISVRPVLAVVTNRCDCSSQRPTETSCGTVFLGVFYECSYDNGVLITCQGAWDCECGYAGNGTCANPGCNLPSACDAGNCCDPNDPTKSSGSYCSASCGGTCNYYDNQDCNWKVASCNVPPASIIKGYKTTMPGNQSQNNPPANIVPYNLIVKADTESTGNNPFSTTVGSACVGAKDHVVSITIPAGYSVGYTKCDSSDPANCPGNETPPPGPLSAHSDIPTGIGDNSQGSGSFNEFFEITTPGQNSYADLWLHYCTAGSWHNSGTCRTPLGQSCGPGGTQDQYDDCGNTRTIPCSTTCSFFQTYGGDVTMKGNLANTQLPISGYYISGR